MVRPDTFINDPKKWFELVTKYKVTHMATLNYTLSVLSDLMERSPGDVAGSDLSSLRALTIGGEYIQADTVSRFASLAKPHGFDPRCFSVCYGMTELMILANTPYFSGLKKSRRGSKGQRVPDPGYILRRRGHRRPEGFLP
ncbi:hypothetical protein HMP0721_1417 [Pseudoramibacter alactolyticus ATCC 23263]|uniref:AMP-dependent synthetase/ligase domain-containing protein n=1 Tax=Pseudoramibacter alactolyticus ATCC 23263 TaxID=887929 RepID=E6MHD2_9FIRM|nr:AMP-binding protein [Pseudoramibacter alactolyticus]EFV01496.1 hypothetical protein HMP0721_1417 [Pseudoramibacter alactolyticus ATCC 23263]